MGATYVTDTRVPVTWVKVGPCIVTQVKNEDKDGYFAIQLGFESKKLKNTSKSLQGHLKKALKNDNFPLHQDSEGQAKHKAQKFPRYIKEIRLDSESDLKVGDVVKLSDVFKKGDEVVVTGVSKGKGFAGVVKRHHFAGGPKTHGQSDRERAPGSIGQRTTPGRVWKGKRMAGRMGQDTVSIKNLIVAEVDDKEGLIAISGGLPGSTGGLLIVRKTGSGKLEELVEETPVAQVVQGEEEASGEEKKSADVPEGTQAEAKVEDKK